MNVIVANKYTSLFNGSNIQIMKAVTGVYKVSEIVNYFKGMYYQKLIIDATALADFPKQEVLKELSLRFDTEKIILFLPPDDSPPVSFLSFLVNIGIYNFTDNINGVMQLISQSNTYEDVKKYISVDDTKIKDVDKSNDEYNLTNLEYDNSCILLGLKNVTKGIASTQLAYTLKKNLEDVYHKRVAVIEIDKTNLVAYNEKNTFSISANRINEFLQTADKYDVVLVDLGENKSLNVCSDIIYLVDPSLYRINELMLANRRAFDVLKGKKVVLYNNLLNERDINIFAREAGINIYFTLPPLNDRIINPVLNNLLYKLGLIPDNNENNTKKGLFDFFK